MFPYLGDLCSRHGLGYPFRTELPNLCRSRGLVSCHVLPKNPLLLRSMPSNLVEVSTNSLQNFTHSRPAGGILCFHRPLKSSGTIQNRNMEYVLVSASAEGPKSMDPRCSELGFDWNTNYHDDAVRKRNYQTVPTRRPTSQETNRDTRNETPHIVPLAWALHLDLPCPCEGIPLDSPWIHSTSARRMH